MPSAWRDEIDTPPSFDSVGSFEGGMVSYAKPRLLAPNQAALLQKVSDRLELNKAAPQMVVNNQ